MKRRITHFVAAAALAIASASACPAAVTNVRFYHLGEDDPGALPGGPGKPFTIDSASAANAQKVGLTFYPSLGVVPKGIGLAPGSTMSMAFVNIDSRYQAPAVTGLIDNFGMEAYIDINHAAVKNAIPFYNGVGAPDLTPAAGCGLRIFGGEYQGFIGPAGIIPSGVLAIPNKPVEMALVRNGGQFQLYINDVLKNTSPIVPTPVAATDELSIGNFFGNYSPPDFSGIVDEARVFTFAPGKFNPTTDLGAAAAGGAVPGDANHDGAVGFDDLITVARNYGLASGATWEQGDFNGDGKVGFDDLLTVARNYGETLTAGQLAALSPEIRLDVEAAFAQVPEPATALAGLAIMGLLLRRR